MKLSIRMTSAVLAMAISMALAGSVNAQEESDVVLPAKISKQDISGEIFKRPDMEKTTRGENTTLDVTTLLSSDKKFSSGMYKSGKVRFEATEPYGVDEFMYFIEGSVTLTSSDGSVQVINAGEAVTIPKEWTGVWDTDGYTKMWVIYDQAPAEE